MANAVFFCGILDQASINALVLHNFITENRNLTRRDFTKQLVNDLMRPQLQRRLTMQRLPRSIYAVIRQILELPKAPEKSLEPRKLDRCILCPRKSDRKTTIYCECCQSPVCESHRTVRCDACEELNYR